MTDAFPPAVYDTIRDGAARSAAIVAPLVIERLGTFTVADIGCGEGHWAAAFRANGCEVAGVDGPHVSHILGDAFLPADIAVDVPPLTADLAVCLEVGEHLPESRADSFVAELCDIAPFVLWSAAIPFQTGPGHINCQWPSYWAEKFNACGYGLDGHFRFTLWDDDRIEPWYRQNIMFATQGAPNIGPLDVVHPAIHGWGR